jgi:DNA/RNA endonuclease YhcR with UshA esterase domain
MGMANKYNAYYFIIACLFSIFSLSTCISYARDEIISPKDAINHIGQHQTVCGIVASTVYEVRQPGKPTYLNLDQSFPDQIFTIVIWGSERHAFKTPPEVFYNEKSVCVTGTITTFEGIPQIIVERPSQINIRSAPDS